MTQSPFPRTIANLRPGDHLCCLYETEEEHRSVLTPFLRHGLERGEKVLYIVDARTASTILDYLRDDGLDVERYLARGQLVVLSADDAYTRGRVFDPDGMIALLRAEAEQALAEGFSALRVTGEMTWALRGLPGSERLMEYENRLNEFFPGSQCLAICQYDRRRFDPAVLLEVLSAHPIAVIGSEVYDNFYYVPPAEQLKGDPSAAMLRNWVKHLADRALVEVTLGDRTHQLGERVKELNCLYGISTLVDQPGISLEEIAQGTVDLIPPSWQYPEVTCARIVLEDQEFRTENFRETAWRQASDIRVRGERIGDVEVRYLEEIAESDEGPFLKEERSLINAIAELLGRITERKWAEDALRESEERVRLLMESTGEAIYGLDLKGNCTLCNPACLRLLGYAEQGDLLGKNMHDVIHHTRPDGRPYPVDECRIYRSFRLGEGVHVDDEVLWRADGTSFPAEYWSYPVKSGDEIVGSVVTFVDIIERKRAEEAQQQLNKKLEDANRHKSEFLANLSHELRTPLNAVLGASELLAEGLFGQLAEKQLEYVRDIHESGIHLLSLINDVLDLSKVEAGKLELHPSHFDLRSLMESSAVIVRERAAGKSLEFNVVPPPEEVVVEADERKIKQIVYNLLSNAVKFTPENGRVVFKAHRDGDEVIFAVEDDGRGVAAEFRERIFEEFFQTATDQEGTGLGLPLAKRLVELHEGRIWLESEEGQGSRFFFAIPVECVGGTRSGGFGATQ